MPPGFLGFAVWKRNSMYFSTICLLEKSLVLGTQGAYSLEKATSGLLSWAGLVGRHY